MIESTGVFTPVVEVSSGVSEPDLAFVKATSALGNSKRVVGAKETRKAIEKDAVQAVVVARDADVQMLSGVITLAREKGLEIIYADSMEALGKACGIKVGAAAAALLAGESQGRADKESGR